MCPIIAERLQPVITETRIVNWGTGQDVLPPPNEIFEIQNELITNKTYADITIELRYSYTSALDYRIANIVPGMMGRHCGVRSGSGPTGTRRDQNLYTYGLFTSINRGCAGDPACHKRPQTNLGARRWIGGCDKRFG